MIGRRLFEILGRNHAEIQLIWLEIIFSESENGKYGFTTLGPDTVLPNAPPAYIAYSGTCLEVSSAIATSAPTLLSNAKAEGPDFKIYPWAPASRASRIICSESYKVRISTSIFGSFL